MLLNRIKRKQTTGNQRKLQILLKVNNETKLNNKQNKIKTSFSAGALCN